MKRLITQLLQPTVPNQNIQFQFQWIASINHLDESNRTLALGKPTKLHSIRSQILLYYPFISVRIVAYGPLSCSKSSSIFNTKSFTPCLCIVGIWARNFNKPKQFSNDSIESHSGDASVSWLRRDMQCLQNVGTQASTSQQNSTHLSINWRVHHQFPIDFDCWSVSVEARIGRLLVVKCLLNCLAWLKFQR